MKRRARRAGGRGQRGPRWKLLQPFLRRGCRAVITTHINPDGDAIGSEMALALFLRQRGVRATIVNSDPVPRLYAFLDPRREVLPPAAPEARRAMESCEVLFGVDNGTLSRLGSLADWVRTTTATRVCIDHHATQDDVWKVRLIDESACSTGAMVHDLILALGGRLSREQAQAIYVALITDTGYFRFARTDASTYRRAAELVDAGVDPIRVYHRIYERNTPAFVRLLGRALGDVRTEIGGRVGWVRLTRAQIVEAGGEQEDTSDIVNSVLTIEGVRVALLFKELEGSRTKVSLRSKGSLDVNALARRLGGGGHRNAAGILLDEPLERGIERVLAAVRAMSARL